MVELMVTLVVAAILLTLAVPNFRDFLLNNRLAGATNEFIAAANLARSEAIKRGRNATVCVSNSASEPRTCSGGNDWGEGWLVWVDADGSGGLNDDERLRVGDAQDNTGVTFTGNISSFRYDATGAIDNTGSIQVCDDRDDENGRRIAITATGRIDLDVEAVGDNSICP